MSPQEFEQALHDAEVKLARLKALYEQWFQGIEKLEPSVARKDLDRTFEMLKKNMPRNTALRFRMQQLWARYGTYGIYWTRIARKIEEGTFRRDVVRATKKRPDEQKRGAEQGYELDVDVEIDDVSDLTNENADPGILRAPNKTGPTPRTVSGVTGSSLAFDESDLDAILGTLSPKAESGPPRSPVARSISPFAMGGARPLGASATFGKPKDKAAPTPAAGLAPPTMSRAPASAIIAKPPAAVPMAPKPPIAVPVPRPPAAVPAPIAPRENLDDGQMRAIYSRYVDARRQNNERTDVRYEALAESVQKLMPKLREKHAGKAIDFEIVMQNGKVGLKPKVGG